MGKLLVYGSQWGRAAGVWSGGRMIFLFLCLSLNFLANSDDPVSLEFFSLFCILRSLSLSLSLGVN